MNLKSLARRTAKALLGSALLAAGLAACSDAHSSHTPAAGVLFVLDTPSSVVEASGNAYRLVIPRGEKLMWFTETPERLAGVVSFDHWLQMWTSMGFTADPPNAALVVDLGDGPRTHIIEMSDPHVEADQVSFALKDAKANASGVAQHAGRVRTHALAAGTMGHTELFIDSVACTTACTTPTTSALTGSGAAELLAKIPAGSVTATSIQLGPNLTINSMTVTKKADGTFSATGTMTVGGVVGINASANFTDATNWALTVMPTTGAPIKIGTTGITLDPSTISGSITDTAGAITWNLNGSTITWPIANGASLTTQFSLGTVCPLSDASKCPTGTNMYLGLPSGSLAISGLPTIQLVGGMTLDGSWARLDGSATASATFSVAGVSVGMNSPSLTVWRGSRTDSYDPNMVLPDTSALTNGTNLEFCGQFTLKIPTLVNTATGGCARWTPNGIVLGQVGLGSGMTLSGGSVPTGTSADIKGIGWSSLSLGDIGKLTLPNGGMPGAISFSGVPTPLFPTGISLGGLSHLPGVVTSAIGLVSPNIDVAVTGKITADSIALQGTVPVSIAFGTEPFKVNINSLTLGLNAGGGQGFSMNLGTSSVVTLGYGTSARPVTSSIQLKAATSPAVGFTLSLTANGVPAADETVDGLTPNTKLTDPAGAKSFLVYDLFGIKGVNLWAMTGQIGWQGGSPTIALATTTYLNPTGATTSKFMACTNSPCSPNDWMIGNLVLDMSLTDPCFVYSFDGGSGTGSIAIDGGVMKATKFQIGAAPAKCSITAGTQTITLGPSFAGLAFSASFGNTTVDVATELTTSGFLFNTSITNLVLGGMTLNSMSLNVSITADASKVDFDALTSANNFAMAIHADMFVDSNGLGWDVSADICTDPSHVYCNPTTVAGGLASQSSGPTSPDQPRDASGNTPTGTSQTAGFKVLQLHVEQSTTIGTCATISGAASGTLLMSKNPYTLIGPNSGYTLPTGTQFGGSKFDVDCNGVQDISFGVAFTHSSNYLSGTATKLLLLDWNGTNQTLEGTYSVSMHRHDKVDGGCCHKDYTFDEDFDINVDMVISSTVFTFDLSAHVHSGRVDGWLNFYLDSTGDFIGKVRIYINVPWSNSTYHIDWDGL